MWTSYYYDSQSDKEMVISVLAQRMHPYFTYLVVCNLVWYKCDLLGSHMWYVGLISEYDVIMLYNTALDNVLVCIDGCLAD